MTSEFKKTPFCLNIWNTTIVFLVFSIFAGCKDSPVYENFSGYTQGTTYSIIFENNGYFDAVELKTKVERILHEFDMSLSLYQDSSVLSRINRNEDIIPDTFFLEAFRISKQISAMTNGAFDITVGPLVKAWGFGPDAQKTFSVSKRDSLLKLVGMEKVTLSDGKVIKTDPRINFDFNAVAQGYSVDVIYDYFNRIGIQSFLIEIGGEVRAKGDKGGLLWRIGIDKPSDENLLPGNDLQAIISLKDKSLATSGNYRKFYVENGIKYSHTIDPRTGYPARNQLLSATIVAETCAIADGVATACMVMGKEKTIEFLSFHPEFDAFLVYSDESGNFFTWATENLERYISEN